MLTNCQEMWSIRGIDDGSVFNKLSCMALEIDAGPHYLCWLLLEINHRANLILEFCSATVTTKWRRYYQSDPNFFGSPPPLRLPCSFGIVILLLFFLSLGLHSPSLPPLSQQLQGTTTNPPPSGCRERIKPTTFYQTQCFPVIFMWI